jgi:hypothetical protein
MHCFSEFMGEAAPEQPSQAAFLGIWRWLHRGPNARETATAPLDVP